MVGCLFLGVVGLVCCIDWCVLYSGFEYCELIGWFVVGCC